MEAGSGGGGGGGGVALIADTGLILCDEPLSNLDADLRERMRAEISSLVREAGIMISCPQWCRGAIYNPVGSASGYLFHQRIRQIG